MCIKIKIQSQHLIRNKQMLRYRKSQSMNCTKSNNLKTSMNCGPQSSPKIRPIIMTLDNDTNNEKVMIELLVLAMMPNKPKNMERFLYRKKHSINRLVTCVLDVSKNFVGSLHS